MTDLATPRLGGIAVIGFACRVPGAASAEAFWRNIADGVESIRRFTPEELVAAGVDAAEAARAAYVPAKGHLEDADRFDAGLFGYSPREASLMDPQHRVMLECAWEALEHGGHGAPPRGSRVAVYAGVGLNTYLLRNVFAHRDAIAGESELALLVGNDKDFVPTRISYQLDLAGPSINVQSACSTSLVAVQMACQSLLTHQCDMALAGGAAITVPLEHGYLHREGGILSADGHCRPFDARAGGTVPGNGAGMVLLKRLEDAIAERDTIHAVIAGAAVNNDGADKIGYTAPGIAGQAAVIGEAHALAGVRAGSIGYVEAHGTGTALGDPIEVAALTAAFRRSAPHNGFCALGAVKANVGHLDIAAGIAGLIKTVMVVKHGVIPPLVHFERPNAALALGETPFYAPTSKRAWTGAGPRRAGVSSFGIGGTNAHVVVEEAPATRPSGPTPRPWQVLCVSARTPQALASAAGRLAGALEAPDAPLADVAFTLARGRRALASRFAIAASSGVEAAALLRAGTRPAPFAADRPVAWLFPGQGAQYAGMGAAAARQEPEFRRALDEALDALERCGAGEVRRLLADASPQARALLAQTANAQPAIFAIEYAYAKLWSSWGPAPSAVLGHSVGEFAAAVVAGVMSLESGARLIAARARLMQALPAGAMVAVDCTEEEAPRWLRAGIDLCAVNAPRSCVFGGALEAVAALERELRREGIEAKRLETSHAFHSAMMQPMIAAFAEELARVTLRPAAIPWMSSLTATWRAGDAACDPGYWLRQVREPVRFAAAVTALMESPGQALVELGPGDTLARLARAQPSPAAVIVSCGARPGGDEGRALAQAMATLWSSGVAIDWERHFALEERRRVPLPTYPFERARYWIDPPSSTAHRAPDTVRPGTGARLYRPEWRIAPAVHGAVPAGSRWLVLADERGLGAALASRLAAAGAAVRTIAATECIGAGEAAFAAWIDAHRPEHVVHLASLEGEAAATRTELEQRGYLDVLALARAMGRRAADGSAMSLTIVSDAVLEATGQDRVIAEKALLLGPARVLPQEHPSIACRLVDVGPAGASAERIERLLAECLARDGERVVAHRGRHRWVQGFAEAAPAQAPAGARAGGTYLITGGFGAVGLAIARHLHRSAGARLVLTGRGPVPDAEECAALVTGDDLVTLDIDAAPPAPALRADPARVEEVHAAVAKRRPVRPVAADEKLARTLGGHAAAMIRDCFECGGASLAPGARHTQSGLVAQLGVVPGYERFVGFMLSMLAGEGVLRREGEAFVVVRRPEGALEPLHARSLAEHPDEAPVFRLLHACGARYLDILRGQVEGVGVLYPGGDASAVEAAVAALASRTSHARWGEVLGTLLAQSARAAPAPLRVLEIGGGNGFLTREVLAALADANVEYWFTDVSRAFVERARAWAAEAGHAGVRFGVLDITGDARAQGFDRGFDAVIGLDVVHATPDIEATLAVLRGLLAPGGSLHLVETSPCNAFNSLVWGVTREWWAHADRLRASVPLMDADAWREAFVAVGFEAVAAHAGAGDAALVFGLRPQEEACAADVLAMQADVTDPSAMAQVVARARERFGAIHGVIHAAGLEASGALARAALDASLPRLAAKVRGARVLEEVLGDEPLDFMMLCSSVAALTGGIGNVEYAAANAFLDAFARERGTRAYPVVSVDWERWRGLGMGAVVEARHRSLTHGALEGGLAPEEALAAFDAIARAPREPQLVVARAGFDEARRHAAADDVTQVAARIVAGARHPRPFLATPFVAPRGELEARIAAVWEQTLGVDGIGAGDDFMELGGDSLIAIQVASRLREALGVSLAVAALFEASTVARLAAHVEAMRWAAAPAREAAAGIEEGEL